MEIPPDDFRAFQLADGSRVVATCPRYPPTSLSTMSHYLAAV